MNILNIGKLEPVMVLEGDIDLATVKVLGGVLLGRYDSKRVEGKKATWVTFESFYLVTQAREMIERGEVK